MLLHRICNTRQVVHAGTAIHGVQYYAEIAMAAMVILVLKL
ncbi:uncharacterized protein G2W53_006629 [Senna tora]|uniref:Uncharacterized protein n=1 Tax=Senna tora TaxID=362788 RepID=A0A834X4B5_9FABA|nr:uncharacterized protein G2W53_006629 [Senna tora]